ncbi:SRPBCC family protein [Flavobacterium terrisoli]|uniref:SRPBCC family protein n=1 Tax=Flavobacterium terrisoli TaxID=3242195 RepID=UPI0025429C8C|nr:SRPBCC domain-containing protein [Flavobacterium buctense]
MITTENKTISIERTLNLPLANVWKAFSEADSFKKWWGPNDYFCPECTIDFKIGGKYLACMESKKNGEKIWSTGSFLEINDYRKIVYTDCFADSEGNKVPASYYKMPGEWPLELIATVELEAVDDRTHISLVHEGIPEDMHSECIAGWEQSLDKLEENVK